VVLDKWLGSYMDFCKVMIFGLGVWLTWAVGQ
jgi:hypothetical protein